MLCTSFWDWSWYCYLRDWDGVILPESCKSQFYWFEVSFMFLITQVVTQIQIARLSNVPECGLDSQCSNSMYSTVKAFPHLPTKAICCSYFFYQRTHVGGRFEDQLVLHSCTNGFNKLPFWRKSPPHFHWKFLHMQFWSHSCNDFSGRLVNFPVCSVW